jgi:hypothetical protein
VPVYVVKAGCGFESHLVLQMVDRQVLRQPATSPAEAKNGDNRSNPYGPVADDQRA